MKTPGSILLAPSPAESNYDLMYYLKGAAAGGICCSITHGALTPVDVVKTRVQLDSAKVRSMLPRCNRNINRDGKARASSI
jgi:solute carrier family 25 phosphate transporter 3